jgi:hypothetical protein
LKITTRSLILGLLCVFGIMGSIAAAVVIIPSQPTDTTFKTPGETYSTVIDCRMNESYLYSQGWHDGENLYICTKDANGSIKIISEVTPYEKQ